VTPAQYWRLLHYQARAEHYRRLLDTCAPAWLDSPHAKEVERNGLIRDSVSSYRTVYETHLLFYGLMVHLGATP